MKILVLHLFSMILLFLGSDALVNFEFNQQADLSDCFNRCDCQVKEKYSKLYLVKAWTHISVDIGVHDSGQVKLIVC